MMSERKLRPPESSQLPLALMQKQILRLRDPNCKGRFAQDDTEKPEAKGESEEGFFYRDARLRSAKKRLIRARLRSE